jgi:hypothetical protein
MVSNIQAFVYRESLGNTYKSKKSSFDFVFFFFLLVNRNGLNPLHKGQKKQTEG